MIKRGRGRSEGWAQRERRAGGRGRGEGDVSSICQSCKARVYKGITFSLQMQQAGKTQGVVSVHTCSSHTEEMFGSL